MGKGEKAITCSTCWTIFSQNLRPINNDQYGTKGNALHLLHLQQVPVCLLSISVPWHLYLVKGFQKGMLEFDDPMGSVSADFRPFQVEVEGKRGKKIRN